MKKLIATLVTFMTTVSAYALPVGNPWDASLLSEGLILEGYCLDYCDPCSSWWDAWSVRVGFYGDYVFNRHTQVDLRERDDSIHSTKIFTNAGFIALNFWERLDLFATFGGTELQFETRSNVLGRAGINYIVKFETDTHFSWSVGLRGTIWECGYLGVGVEAQYFHTRPELNLIWGEAENPFYFQNSDRAKYQEWQFGLGASYRINIGWCSTALIPYVAAKWDRVHISFDHLRVAATSGGTYTLDNLENERDWGFALGLTLVGCHKASVTVEGRFANEHAVYVNTQFRF